LAKYLCEVEGCDQVIDGQGLRSHFYYKHGLNNRNIIKKRMGFHVKYYAYYLEDERIAVDVRVTSKSLRFL